MSEDINPNFHLKPSVKSMAREEKAAYMKVWNAKPEVRAINRARKTTPEAKAAAKVWLATPEGQKARKEAHKAYEATPEGIAARKTSNLKIRCANVYTSVENYESLPKKCSIRRCTALVPCGFGDWHLDHDKVAKIFRGLLCAKHNRKVGDLTLDDVEDTEEYLLLSKCKIRSLTRERY